MGVSIHYRGRVAEIQNIKAICDELAAIAERMKMDFVGEKIAAVSATLSVVNKGHIEKFSADELASMIEALLRDKFG